MKSTQSILVLSSFLYTAQAAFFLADDYSGAGFFNKWDFYDGFDQYTNGDAQYVGQSAATAARMAYTNDKGNIILRVDNFTDVVYPNKRNTIRLESKATYGVGSVWIFDALHIPYGCSVWPSFWTHGEEWPKNGEIDIMEGVNGIDYNQMALHSNPLAGPGCTKVDVPQTQTGQSLVANCSTVAGCTVKETKPNSYGAGFAQAGGGVYATQFDSTGIYIWFWSRNDVPKSIKESTSTSSIDIADWGLPSASYPKSSCDIDTYFQAQQLTITTTICGDWAGAPAIYGETCTAIDKVNPCYVDNVISPTGGPAKYDNAYFEIQFIRAYSAVQPSSTAASGTSTSPSSTGTQATSSQSPGNGSGASHLDGLSVYVFLLVASAVAVLVPRALF